MEAGKHGLRRELKLWDLVPLQVVLILSISWAPVAAKQCSTQIVLWLLAILLFYLPLAAVVMKLSRALPVEGGVYQWVKAGISPLAGYMAAWNLTIYAILIFSVTGSILANTFAYGAGPNGAWMLTSSPFALALTVSTCLIAYLFNVRGWQLTKWLSDLTAASIIGIFLVMFYLLARAWATAMPSARGSVSLGLPTFSLLTLNVLTKMAVGALSGFDSSAVFAEECRKPENDVARSVLIAAPVIATIYILGTCAVLTYIPPANVDLAAGVPQVMLAGFGSTGLGGAITMIAVASFGISWIAQMVVFTGMVARLPMVVGWDGLLPRWWSELHPRFRTPFKAIGAVEASIVILGALSLLGAGNQEAVQVGNGAGVGSLCIMYMLLFAVIPFGFRTRMLSPGWGLRLAALAAFLTVMAAFVFVILPVGEVANPALFALKVAAAIGATNILGAYLYWRGTRRQNNPEGVQNW